MRKIKIFDLADEAFINKWFEENPNIQIEVIQPVCGEFGFLRSLIFIYIDQDYLVRKF